MNDKPKNTDQDVNQNKYRSGFDRIFGIERPKDVTGTYKYDSETRQMIKIDATIPKVVLNHIENVMNDVRRMGSIPIKKKGT